MSDLARRVQGIAERMGSEPEAPADDDRDRWPYGPEAPPPEPPPDLPPSKSRPPSPTEEPAEPQRATEGPTRAPESLLAQLVRPFPAAFIMDNPTGFGRYVSHDVVTQRLLQVLGPFTFRAIEVLRGDVTGREGKPNLGHVVVGVIAELEVSVDGRTVRVQEVGDCERPDNWPHDGARLKDAMSDAIKRCAMRLGVGLHLWAKSPESFYLYKRLTEQ